MGLDACHDAEKFQLLVQKHFRTKKPERTEAQKNAHRESILAQVPEEQRKSISDALLDQAMGMDMVGLLPDHQ